jgi:3-oxoadipate enol-lactonase
MPTVEANGQTLYYEVHGDGEPLVCVMGLSADVLAWALQVQAFSAAHRTVVFDNRDVGRSSREKGEYEIADMARDTLALADALELESFHLLGYSMGGAIAQELACQAPERVRSLTLAVTFASGGAWARKLSEVWGSRVHKISYEEHIDELMLLNHSEEFFENAEGVAFVRNMMLQNPHPQRPDAFARQLAASTRHDARERLASLALPVHVIGAGHDLLVPVWKSRDLAALIPGAKLTILEGAPHGACIERAEELNRVVLDFVAAAREPTAA